MLERRVLVVPVIRAGAESFVGSMGGVAVG